MTTPKEPREFWIFRSTRLGKFVELVAKTTPTNHKEQIHVIEYSAYEQLREECEDLKLQLHDALGSCDLKAYMVLQEENEQLKADQACAKKEFEQTVRPFALGGDYNLIPILKEENAKLTAEVERLKNGK